MRDHIRREAAAQDVSPAWLLVPMSLVTAGLLVVVLLDGPPAQPSPAAAVHPLSTAAEAVPAAWPSPEPLPIHHDHVQAF